MDGERSVQQALDLLDIIAIDPEAVWAVLDDDNRAMVEVRLQQLSDLAEAIQKEEDIAKSTSDLMTLAATLQGLVNSIPELCALLLPPEIGSEEDLPKLSAWKDDLGDSMAVQRAQAQKFAAQIHNHLVLIRQALPPQAVMGEKPQQQQSQHQQ
jgi:hypothetical protein